MILTKDERLFLNALSKRIYGSTSFWYNKLHKNGVKNPAAAKDESTVRYLTTYQELVDYMQQLDKTRTELLAKAKENADQQISPLS